MLPGLRALQDRLSARVWCHPRVAWRTEAEYAAPRSRGHGIASALGSWAGRPGPSESSVQGTSGGDAPPCTTPQASCGFWVEFRRADVWLGRGVMNFALTDAE